MKKKVLGITLCFLVVLIGVGIYAVDKVFNMLLYQQIGLEDSVEYIDIVSETNKERQISEELAEDTKDIHEEVQQDSKEDEGNNNTEVLQEDQDIGSESKNRNSDQSSVSQEPKVISNEAKIKEIEKQVSFSDKAKAFSILFSSLTPEDRSRLLQMANGGITQSEKAEAIQILASRLRQEEKDTIKSLYGKYEYLLHK